VLVTYASKHGATAEIAETVAEKLREYDLEVDCVPVSRVSSLQDYQAVVIGSALYFNRWRGDAARFVRHHAAELSQNGPDSHQLEPRRLVDTIERLHARGHIVFGGSVAEAQHGPLTRVLVRKIRNAYRDRRDWAEIRTWAAGIAEGLDAGHTESSTPARGPDQSGSLPES
jgi:menaquinone-dependent protoporphyrinogen oxidase